MEQLKPVHHNYRISQCAATPDTRAPGAYEGEPTALRSLRAAAKSSPHWQQLEKAQVQQQIATMTKKLNK